MRRPDGHRWRVIHDLRNADKIEYPSAGAMVKSAAKAAADFAASGFKVIDATERERRLDICHACEFFDAGRCRKCGCFMTIKARIAASRCPIGKW